MDFEKTYRYKKDRQLKKYNFVDIIHCVKIILYVLKAGLCIQSALTQFYLNPFTLNVEFMFGVLLVPNCTHLFS